MFCGGLILQLVAIPDQDRLGPEQTLHQFRGPRLFAKPKTVRLRGFFIAGLFLPVCECFTSNDVGFPKFAAHLLGLLYFRPVDLCLRRINDRRNKLQKHRQRQRLNAPEFCRHLTFQFVGCRPVGWRQLKPRALVFKRLCAPHHFICAAPADRARDSWPPIRRDNPANICRGCGRDRADNPSRKCRSSACRQTPAARRNYRPAALP